ncbi:MAG TPA: type I DNA topoisomerase [Candidatus Binatia bacterium]|nr:type I DNA topoisomerase [Candidatus Binatia bacterium]
MAKNLVIVESPAKAKTLGKYLGRDYQVKASVGHVMDLPKSKLGVDIENDFAPEYHVIQGKAKVLDEIKRAAKDKENVYLAPDPDREGEAIAWHIAQKLGPRRKNVHRVLFNEITKKAVLEALKNPAKLDRNRFDAQQARRILDRLVGYKLSPLLWDKVRRGLSAGRVQSVAVRIIAEREREIRAFTPEEYWTVEARLEGGQPPPFNARLVEVGGEKIDKLKLDSRDRVDEVLCGLDRGTWSVTKVERKERRKHPTPPFITSRLQQEASRKLGFQPSRTMRIAQRLYEGVELGDEGSVGLITYMRTDSTRISGEAIGATRDYIKGRYGDPYLPESPNVYRSKKDAQDAHEAIRPTSMEYDPETVARWLDKDELALYTLIWNRFVASQMESAVYDATAVDIESGNCRFRATGQILKFDGFIRVYTEGRDDEQTVLDEDREGQLPELAEGETLKLLDLLPEQHFTQPPPRFTQATLIKELEEKGIGRPSTYASIMGTILNKEYVVEDEQRRLKPTELGFLVTDLLVESFPDVLNVEFTAGMENELDAIEEGEEHYVDTLRRFWHPFAKDLEKAEVEMRDVKREERPTGLTCEKCGQPLVIKWGRRGEFLACSAYPECKNTKNFTRDDDGTIRPVEPETTNEVCEKCGRPMQVRFGRYGKFLGCSGYPECKNMQPIHKPVPTGVKCLLGCGEGELMERRSRRGKLFYSCNRYPECQFVAWDRPVPQACPTCGAGFVTEKVTKRYGTVRRCVREGCGWQQQIDTGDGGDYAPLPERRAAAQIGGRRRPSTKTPTAAARRRSTASRG